MADQKKDPTAQAMVKKRWAKTSPEERSELARKLNQARWGSRPAKRPKKGKKEG